MVQIPVDVAKLKQQTVNTLKQRAIAEAQSRSHAPLQTGISIVVEGSAIGLFCLFSVGVVTAMNFSPVDWGKRLIGGALQSQIEKIPGVGNLVSNTSSAAASPTGKKIADAALAWTGKDFNPGVSAQCAFFVRQVFEDAGVEVGVGKNSFWGVGSYAYPGLAGSFFSDEIGQKVAREDLQPGDLIAFRDTYGNFPPGTITHIGIYVGNGMMVDRSTRSAPVYHRSINTFGDKFMFGVRPHVYGE